MSNELYYRKLMCASIELAVQQALSRSEWGVKVRADAINYLNGEMFQFHMDLLGLDDAVEPTREMIRREIAQRDYQLALRQTQTKVCRRCGEEKNAGEDYHRNPKCADGINPYCIDCEREMGREFYARKLAKVMA